MNSEGERKGIIIITNQKIGTDKEMEAQWQGKKRQQVFKTCYEKEKSITNRFYNSSITYNVMRMVNLSIKIHERQKC